MSKNCLTEINFERFDQDRHGHKIPIHRKTVKFLSKQEVIDREAKTKAYFDHIRTLNAHGKLIIKDGKVLMRPGDQVVTQ